MYTQWYVQTQFVGFLRGDDDSDQLGSASTTIECIVCDGSGVGGDGHICTATAGGTAAIRSHYRQENTTYICKY